MINFLKNHNKIIFLILMIAAAAFIAYLNFTGKITVEDIKLYLESHPIEAPIVFIFIFAIAVLFFSPTMPLNLVAGFLWGIWLGGVLTILGIILGSVLSFLLSRYIFQDFVKKILGTKAVEWINSKTDKDGWKIVAFTRLNPIFPAAVINYSFGLTSITFKDFFIGTVIFSIPPTIAVSAFGDAFNDYYAGSISGIIISILIGIITFLVLFKSKGFFSKWLTKKENT